MKTCGKLRAFTVEHPAHGVCAVSARSEEEAIVEAARQWGVDWTRYAFYAWCEVYPL